ncbi:hypothetical protein ACROYT_G014262 [Oculina patagonica]
MEADNVSGKRKRKRSGKAKESEEMDFVMSTTVPSESKGTTLYLMRQYRCNAKYYQSRDKTPAKKMAVQADDKDKESLYKEPNQELKKTKPRIIYQTQQLTMKSRRKEIQSISDMQTVLSKLPFLKVEESSIVGSERPADVEFELCAQKVIKLIPETKDPLPPINKAAFEQWIEILPYS